MKTITKKTKKAIESMKKEANTIGDYLALSSLMWDTENDCERTSNEVYTHPLNAFENYWCGKAALGLVYFTCTHDLNVLHIKDFNNFVQAIVEIRA